MSETKRTLVFVVVAAVSAGAATATYYGSRPKPDADYGNIGKEFYPDFQDPTAAQMLRVVAYDPDTASVKEFKVEYKDGQWRIPSHLNYPADGKDRLARTAASVIGTSRVALATRVKNEQANYDVVDPEDPDPTILKGRGQKITIAKNDGTVLAEFVIGKKVEGQQDAYYVRGTKTDDADVVYLAKLKIDLSTKFSDWIEPDLLKVDRENLTDIRIDNYSINETQGVIEPGEINELTKKSSSDAWSLDGIKPGEELKTDVVNQLVNNLDNLRLVGVRKKPEGVNADLSIDSKFAQSRELVLALRGDMANRGFYIASDRRGGKTRLVSKEGELEAGTNQGVRYALHFGQIFTGTEFEIETGLSKDAKGADKSKKSPADKGAAAGADKSDKKDSLKKSRYLMVYTTFDPKLVGQPPTKPNEPKKPEGLVLDSNGTKSAPDKEAAKAGTKPGPAKGGAAPKSAPPAGGKASSKVENDDANLLALALPDAKTDQKPEAKPKDADKPAAPSKVAPKSAPAKLKAAGAVKSPPTAKAAPKAAPPVKPDPKAEYDKAMAQYKKDVERYENDKSEFAKKLTKGQEKVKELNERFGPWYYVISAESFENLRLARGALVKPKDASAEKKEPPHNTPPFDVK